MGGQRNGTTDSGNRNRDGAARDRRNRGGGERGALMTYNIYFVEMKDEHEYPEFSEDGYTLYTYGFPANHVVAQTRGAAKWAFVQSLKRDEWNAEITDRMSVRLEAKGFDTAEQANDRLDRDFAASCEVETDEEIAALKAAGNLYLHNWQPQAEAIDD